MYKNITSNEEARKKLKKGIDTLANAVKITLGPSGRNVVIGEQYQSPHITKDGVTVAKSIFLKDPDENLGCQILKQVSQKTADLAGDGTTTATVLAQAMISEGMKYIVDETINTTSVTKGMMSAVKIVTDFIKENSTPITLTKDEVNMSVQQVATIAANGDTFIGDLIAKAYQKIGIDGIISIGNSMSEETKIDIVEGLRFERSYMHPYFITNPNKMTVEYDDVKVILLDKKVNSLKEIIPILKATTEQNYTLLMIVHDMEDKVLQDLTLNKMQGNLRIVVVKAPGFGEHRRELMQDMANLTGGQLITDHVGGTTIEKATLASFGSVDSLLIDRDNTTIIGGHANKEAIENTIVNLQQQLLETNVNYDVDKIKERLANLSGGVAVIKVGAATDVELKEKKDRIDDALHAADAALREGVIPGGGTLYVKAINRLNSFANDFIDDEVIGFNIIKNSLSVPLWQITKNGGYTADVIVDNVRINSNIEGGFNAKTGHYVNMLTAGIVDSVKVARLALINAASVASTVLTTEVIITERDINNSVPQFSDLN